MCGVCLCVCAVYIVVTESIHLHTTNATGKKLCRLNLISQYIYSTGDRARSFIYIIFTYNKANSNDFGVEIDFARLSMYLNRNISLKSLQGNKKNKATKTKIAKNKNALAKEEGGKKLRAKEESIFIDDDNDHHWPMTIRLNSIAKLENS